MVGLVERQRVHLGSRRPGKECLLKYVVTSIQTGTRSQSNAILRTHPVALSQLSYV